MGPLDASVQCVDSHDDDWQVRFDLLSHFGVSVTNLGEMLPRPVDRDDFMRALQGKGLNENHR